MRHTKHVRYNSYEYNWLLRQGWRCKEVVDDMATLYKDE